jgi:hypothetical protein
MADRLIASASRGLSDGLFNNRGEQMWNHSSGWDLPHHSDTSREKRRPFD